MAESMDFDVVINDDENTDTNEEDNSEVNDIPSGQKPRNELQIAEDAIKDITKLNKLRYPLRTLVSLMKYQTCVKGKLNLTYSENMDIIVTQTELSGEVSTKLSSKSKEINEHFTHKLKVFKASLQPRNDNQNYQKRTDNQSYQKKTWTKQKADKYVLKELQDLVAKLNK
ncbi:unnamed protein product [Mytilus coruscus]|uniref:Uncharacterized protein n=1 Tax=Mytilus coruscus TaxID=42192 RepID=A0A6J8B3X2_MYTCO|nr:unnamed protein product [Mytilus coruscus]